ncbi:MAG: bifunctional methylenetetrahydrofolate dehydrogenase/methenyltetrahydrofolate cyclohydrolase FolD [Sphingomonadaceae bacterium]
MKLIDGKAMAADLRAAIAAEVARRVASGRRAPALAVVLVGDDPASHVYVRNKVKACRETGIASIEHRLAADTPEDELLRLVDSLNSDPAIDGILVQLPLPQHCDQTRVIAAIAPAKDVDGFHPENAGRLALGLPGFVPCTPAGCLKLLLSVHADLAGAEALVIGRSTIVGRPMASLLVSQSATVTIAHSKSHDLPALTRRADIVVAAVGRPEMLRGDWLKPGATVIDVGINRVTDAKGKARLVGDVAFAEAAEVAGALTPVPGGVGPMTIACLLENTLRAAA